MLKRKLYTRAVSKFSGVVRKSIRLAIDPLNGPGVARQLELARARVITRTSARVVNPELLLVSAFTESDTLWRHTTLLVYGCLKDAN